MEMAEFGTNVVVTVLLAAVVGVQLYFTYRVAIHVPEGYSL